ncbi:MAG: putative DNA-binding domain-containing protein [Planctomycetes bacterium]|nr:putative DNA-binding domain-containing protein [Planctomycetota bacterium]
MPAARSRTPRELDGLERWFQAEILRPHTRKRAAAQPAARHLLPSRALSAAERIGIYQSAYMLRLLECMRADFPGVHALAGEKRFARLVSGYLERHPSRHWSLNPLGKDFARYLEREAPRGPRIALLAQLAQLEWNMQVVFEAPASESLAGDALASIAPESWARTRLVPIEALRLLSFDYRCNAIASAVRRREPLPPLGRKRSFVAVYRKEWTVWRMDLDALQFELLASLCRGRTLARALEDAAGLHRGPQAELLQRIQSACASFVSEGFFRAFR